MSNFSTYARNVDPFFHLRETAQVIRIHASLATPEDLEARKTISRFDPSRYSWIIPVDVEEIESGPKLWTCSRLMIITLLDFGAFAMPREFFAVWRNDKKLAIAHV